MGLEDYASASAAVSMLKNRGFVPTTVIDCGAGVGDWTKAVQRVLPAARFLMIDPLDNNRARLENMESPTVDYEKVLLGAGEEEIDFFQHGFQSSIYPNTNGDPWGEPTKINTKPLDKLTDYLEGPILLKMDVQGSELNVLQGAARTLERVEVIMLELTLFPFMEGMPTIVDVMNYMDYIGFMVYEFIHAHKRPIDGRVGQYDVIYISKQNSLVSDNRWSNDF